MSLLQPVATTNLEYAFSRVVIAQALRTSSLSVSLCATNIKNKIHFRLLSSKISQQSVAVSKLCDLSFGDLNAQCPVHGPGPKKFVFGLGLRDGPHQLGLESNEVLKGSS
ncbi:hypothetical protein CEXT_415361 [Caerostris extrusa]|uniref:Uncharacterized protein n=1 Tax=Caerostris extrusa TaxID=172846 RepID=A0AAV4VIC2_CAEEX|nr:hypothetical protein CEXT_415361 [Caerostris extrusa]